MEHFYSEETDPKNFVEIISPAIEKACKMIINSREKQVFEIKETLEFVREWFSLLSGVKQKNSMALLKDFCISNTVSSNSAYGLVMLFELGISNFIQMF